MSQPCTFSCSWKDIRCRRTLETRLYVLDLQAMGSRLQSRVSRNQARLTTRLRDCHQADRMCWQQCCWSEGMRLQLAYDLFVLEGSLFLPTYTLCIEARVLS